MEKFSYKENGVNDSNAVALWTTSRHNDSFAPTSTYSLPASMMEGLNTTDYVEQVLKGIAMSTVILATVLGNIIVICAFAKFKSLKSMNNCFIVSLAVADLLVGKFDKFLYYLQPFVCARKGAGI